MQAPNETNALSQIAPDSVGVSVVMSVYDREDHVERTIKSVLAQTDVNVELVIVDDGASAAVKALLQKYVSNRKVIILEQENKGLTQALMNGCAHARYDFIARIDAGDSMTESRLSKQSQVLASQETVCMVCSWVTMVTEEGYLLYEIKPEQATLQTAAIETQAEAIKTPFHSSVMFRKSIYQQAGGYRPEFYFSQDCDLWARMAHFGEFVVIPEFLTIGLFTPSGISGRHAEAQRQLTRLVAEANQYRSIGEADTSVLNKAQRFRPGHSSYQSSVDESDFPTLYFLARCLSRNRSKHARQYWSKAIAAKPLSLKSWVNLLLSYTYRGAS